MALAQNGKVVSERHEEAEDRGMVTAGRMAKRLSQHVGQAVTAKELKPHADEWHHSGFYKGSNGSTMGRTYFFEPDTDLDRLWHLVCAERDAEAKVAAEPDVTRHFFVVKFRKRYGKRGGYQPVADFQAIDCKPSSDPPNNGTEISAHDYQLATKFNGEDLRAYETFSEFKTRMGVNHDNEAA